MLDFRITKNYHIQVIFWELLDFFSSVITSAEVQEECILKNVPSFLGWKEILRFFCHVCENHCMSIIYIKWVLEASSKFCLGWFLESFERAALTSVKFHPSKHRMTGNWGNTSIGLGSIYLWLVGIVVWTWLRTHILFSKLRRD
jgi:hypothetical protein